MIVNNLEDNDGLTFTFNIIKEKMKDQNYIPPETQVTITEFSTRWQVDGRTAFTLHGWLDDGRPISLRPTMDYILYGGT